MGRIRGKIKNIILKSITVVAGLTILVCASSLQVWDGTTWVEPDPLRVVVPIIISTAWLLAFGIANGLT